MTEEQHDIMIKAIQDAVKETVNGKIIGIQSVLDRYIAGDVEWKEGEAIWKEDNKEALANMKNLTIGWKVFLSFCTGIAAIGGAIFIIWKLAKI